MIQTNGQNDQNYYGASRMNWRADLFFFILSLVIYESSSSAIHHLSFQSNHFQVSVDTIHQPCLPSIFFFFFFFFRVVPCQLSVYKRIIVSIF